MRGADVFIGVSAGKVSEGAVASMSPDAMVFALANPDPEVEPAVAAKYAKVVATGRSDYPNQINNVLAFPGIFKGALEVGATQITKGMKLAAAKALAQVVGDDVAFDHVDPERLRRAGRTVGGRGGAQGGPRGRRPAAASLIDLLPFEGRAVVSPLDSRRHSSSHCPREGTGSVPAPR